jgi:hypothetical protein
MRESQTNFDDFGKDFFEDDEALESLLKASEKTVKHAAGLMIAVWVGISALSIGATLGFIYVVMLMAKAIFGQ